ncbi:MAG: hypothetical protein FJ284_06400 [Planctomycetes bacterium]|nr:hypothetical protein [Planctomycetota bacterium]
MPSRTIRRRRRRCRRPRHTILPGTVLRGDEPEFLLACIGLNNHPQGQVQTLVNVLDLGMNPQRAVDAAVPRGDDLRQGATRRGLFGTDRSGTGRAGHQIGAPSAFKGAAQIVRIRRGEEGVGPCLETGSITGSTGSPSAGNAGGPDGLSGPRCRSGHALVPASHVPAANVFSRSSACRIGKRLRPPRVRRRVPDHGSVGASMARSPRMTGWRSSAVGRRRLDLQRQRGFGHEAADGVGHLHVDPARTRRQLVR